MNESTLTQLLVENLRKGAIKKIARSQQGKKIEFRREVGNNSFRADIFITLSQEKHPPRVHDGKGAHFIAIEVKIKDWMQGLYQAWRYNSFAEKSYLALYKPYAKNVDLALFKKYNVGLIIFTEESVEVLNRPKSNKFAAETYSNELRKTLWERSSLVKCA